MPAHASCSSDKLLTENSIAAPVAEVLIEALSWAACRAGARAPYVHRETQPCTFTDHGIEGGLSGLFGQINGTGNSDSNHMRHNSSTQDRVLLATQFNEGSRELTRTKLSHGIIQQFRSIRRLLKRRSGNTTAHGSFHANMFSTSVDMRINKSVRRKSPQR